MIQSNWAIIFFLSITWLPKVHAEYRVYQYYVKSRYSFPIDSKAYITSSTLDPISFLAYHGGATSISIDMIRTWLCLGDTSHFKAICPSPYKLVSTQDLEGTK